MKRPSWDEYFMKIVEDTAVRSSCDRAMVGAVIVVDNDIVSTGYNSAPAGTSRCDEEGHAMIKGHCLRTIHAEQNAVVRAARRGVSTKGGTIYVTHKPCIWCVKLIINAGISEVVYGQEYRSEDEESLFADELLKQAGVKVIHFQKQKEGK